MKETQKKNKFNLHILSLFLPRICFCLILFDSLVFHLFSLFLFCFSDWKENYNSQNLLLGTSCSNQNMNNNQHQQQPKLENFLGGHSFGEHDQTYGGNSASTDYMFPTQPVDSSGGGSSTSNSNNSIGLSMIKTWLRNQPPHSENKNENGNSGSVQTLSLSMSTGSQSSTSLPILSASVENGESSSDNKQPPTTAALDTTPTGATESAPRKSIDTFGQRTSIYRGVTRFLILYTLMHYYI